MSKEIVSKSHITSLEVWKIYPKGSSVFIYFLSLSLKKKKSVEWYSVTRQPALSQHTTNTWLSEQDLVGTPSCAVAGRGYHLPVTLCSVPEVVPGWWVVHSPQVVNQWWVVLFFPGRQASVGLTQSLGSGSFAGR